MYKQMQCYFLVFRYTCNIMIWHFCNIFIQWQKKKKKKLYKMYIKYKAKITITNKFVIMQEKKEDKTHQRKVK